MTRSCQEFSSPPRHTVGDVNEITPVKNVGRPRLELSAVRRDALEQLALRIERLIAELAEARVELSAVARAGRSEGASIRAIAEAVRLSRPRVYELLHDASKSRQGGESMEVNPTCG
jgi:uncharacterized protein (UPF0335 family)